MATDSSARRAHPREAQVAGEAAPPAEADDAHRTDMDGAHRPDADGARRTDADAAHRSDEVADSRSEQDGASRPWALEVFDHSLKKRLKVELLTEMAGELGGKRCLLVTCGDNPGALNWHLRKGGGEWHWAEMEPERIPAMEALLGDPVEPATAGRLPFEDQGFDLVVSIDVHEHLDEVEPFNRELARLLAPGGRALVTTPNGDRSLPLARVKRLLGMSPKVYGHRVQGYTTGELASMLAAVGLEPEDQGAYSRFFTESIELAINLAYVKVLGRSPGGESPKEGEIAPASEGELKRLGGPYRVYRAVYPLLRAVSHLDRLIPGSGGYAVAVLARKSS